MKPPRVDCRLVVGQTIHLEGMVFMIRDIRPRIVVLEMIGEVK